MIAIVVPGEFIEHISQAVNTVKSASSHIFGTLLTIAWLDTHISMVKCFCYNGVNKIGGHCQRLYFDAFSSLLAIVFRQHNCIFETFALQLIHEQIEVLSLECYANTVLDLVLLSFQAIEKVFVSFSK